MKLGARGDASERVAAADLRLPLVEDPGLPWRFDRPSMRVALPSDKVVAIARGLREQPGRFVVGGGEPIRRADATELLADLAGLRPDGLALCTAGEGVTEPVAERLAAVGVERVFVPFHCARQDAHDWLVGRPGALKVAHRAIRSCVRAGLRVVAEVVITRPTMPHLAETVEVLARSGVREVVLRRLLAADANGLEFIPLAPRLELLRESIERAAAVAIERKVRLQLRDLPSCAAPRLRPLFAAPGSELWVSPDGSCAPRSVANAGCVDCPGLPECGGAPPDYVERFGWEEFVDEATIGARMAEDVAAQQRIEAGAPMVFSWAGPRRVRCEHCGDGELADESPRQIRARMVIASRYRPERLRLVGADLLAHPQAASFVYDALRLFPHVEVAGEASPIVDWTDLDLRRMKDLRRLDVALYGPDATSHDAHCGIPGAFAATRRAVERFAGGTEVPVGAYALLHDSSMVADFAEAWERGELPGEPRFRLSRPADGAAEPIADLIRAVEALPPGAARTALAALLPRCSAGDLLETDSGFSRPVQDRGQQIVALGRSVAYRACGTDPIGEFGTCEDAQSCAASGCPGIAVGW